MRTNFEEIKFNPRLHTYSYEGWPLTAVMQVCRQFKEPFDRDYWAQREAEEYGVSVYDILAEWQISEDAGREKGEKVHAYIKQILSAGPEAEPDSFLALNEWPDEAQIFGSFWRQRLSAYAEPFQCEWVVGDAALGIAGTIDAVLRHRDTGEYHIFDWKTNRKFTTENPRGKKLLPPFDDLTECDLNFYSLQVSLYRLILSRKPDFAAHPGGALGRSYIVHLGPGGYQIHPALDLSDRLLAVLEKDSA